MDRQPSSVPERDLEDLLIGLDQLTQLLEVRLAQANRLKQWLYQQSSRPEETITPQQRQELQRIRAASLRLLGEATPSQSTSLH